MSTSRSPFTLGAGVAIVAGLLVGWAVPLHAQIPSGNGVIYACVRMDRDHDEGKLVRLVAANETCRRNEVRLHWNMAGLPGPVGPAGPKGPTGPKGDTGLQGPQGVPGVCAFGGITGHLASCTPNVDFSGALVFVPGHAFSAVTGADGAFSFDVMPPGQYPIVAEIGGKVVARVLPVTVGTSVVALTPNVLISDTSSDPNNCGECSRVCASGLICISGQCSSGCIPGSVQSCYDGSLDSLNVGMCRAGSQVCNSDGLAWGSCLGQVTPSPEVCDGRDNNCDGRVDEGIPDTTCACDGGGTGTLSCMSGNRLCLCN